LSQNDQGVSPGHPLGDGRVAIAVDRPLTQTELAQRVHERIKSGLAVYPQGGATSLDSGGIPSRDGVALDTRALNRVVDYPAADMTITVEAGITLDALQRALAEQGQRLNLEAPHSDRATLGGVYATDTCGPRRFGYGRPRDQIIGVTFATSDGELVKGGGRVVKNVAGYDFPKLLTGSFGTLGVITQLTLKVRPTPESTMIIASAYKNLDDLGSALDALNTSATRPVAIELLNREAAKVAGFWSDTQWTLILGFEGSSEAVAWQSQSISTELGKLPIWSAQEQVAQHAWRRLVHLQHFEESKLTLRVTMPPSRVADFLAQDELADWTIHTHAGDGIAWIHAPSMLEKTHAINSWKTMREKVHRWGGSVVAARCPTDWKSRLGVWGFSREDWLVGERVRMALDPSGLLNPGRFVSTIE
jgi:glycolate dehydrogenase FAD-binding subunit